MLPHTWSTTALKLNDHDPDQSREQYFDAFEKADLAERQVAISELFVEAGTSWCNRIAHSETRRKAVEQLDPLAEAPCIIAASGEFKLTSRAATPCSPTWPS